MSAKAEVTTPEGMTIEIDNSAILEHVDKKMKKYMEELKEYRAKPAGGKGVVEAVLPGNASKIVEELRNVRQWTGKSLKEQWTITIPNYTTKEVAAHLRDYVYVTDIIKGAPGDTVNIPYVKDFDFETLSAVGDTFAAETTGLINVLTTTLKEAGAWSDIEYYNIEKIDQNLLDELNRTFAHAAVRAEDENLIKLLEAGTSTNFAGDIGRKTGPAYFYAANIPEAIGKLLEAGKEVHPGDCVLYITPKPYASLLDELVASNAFAYARGDVIQKGMIEDYLGVRIVVGGYTTSQQRTNAATGTCDLAFLFRAKRCIALAPKRDILIETDRQIAARELRITGSHTFGIKLLDAKEAVRIWCNTADGSI